MTGWEVLCSLMLLRTAAKRSEEGVNATALPEKQEVRRNPKADGDGFMASTTT